MAQERSGAATVIAQEGERLDLEHGERRLTVDMRGFPPGFRLLPGSRVILYDEPSGPVARPLVRVTRSRLAGEAVRQRRLVDLNGRPAELQPSTIVEEPRDRAAVAGVEEYEVWTVERTGVDATKQVIAARRRP